MLLENLKVLSLGRNNIKNLNGLVRVPDTRPRVFPLFSTVHPYPGFVFVQEAVSDSLVQLWISYNSIEKLKGIGVLKKLKVSLQKGCSQDTRISKKSKG